MKQAALLLDFLAATYQVDLDGRSYVENLVAQAVPLLDRGLGVVAYTYDARDPSRPIIGDLALSSRFDPEWLGAFYGAVEAASLDHGHDRHPTGFQAWAHLTSAQVSSIRKMRGFLPLLAHFGGARDVFALNALDATGHGVWLGAPWPRITKETPERAPLFGRIAAHLSAANRLRRASAQERRASQPSWRMRAASCVVRPSRSTTRGRSRADVTSSAPRGPFGRSSCRNGCCSKSSIRTVGASSSRWTIGRPRERPAKISASASIRF